MQKIKRALSVVCFLVLFVVCGAFLRYILVDDVGSYTRIMEHELYTQEENIDILLSGSSHCYRTLDPRITDGIFHANTFNIGSSAQEMDGSLALIKEAVKDNDVKQIYLEVYYDIAMQEPYEEREDLTQVYIVADYMKPSINRVKYLLEASSKKHYVNSFILARRNWEKLFDIGYIKELVQKKNWDTYKDYAYIATDVETYEGKGYVAVDMQGDTWSKQPFYTIDITKVSEDYKNSLQEIIDFCSKHDIELTLFSSTMPDFRLANVGNYDEYIDFVDSLIEGTDVKYYDFNLCREEYLPVDETCFADYDHLNDKGSQMFSKVFAEFFTGQIAEEDLFYDSYAKKLADQEPSVYGFILDGNMEGSEYTLIPVTNSDADQMELTVLWVPEDGESSILLEQSKERTVSLPVGVAGSLDVTAYLDGKEVYHNQMKIT